MPLIKALVSLAALLLCIGAVAVALMFVAVQNTIRGDQLVPRDRARSVMLSTFGGIGLMGIVLATATGQEDFIYLSLAMLGGALSIPIGQRMNFARLHPLFSLILAGCALVLSLVLIGADQGLIGSALLFWSSVLAGMFITA